MIGSCKLVGGTPSSPVLLDPCVICLKLVVNKGDMKLIGLPPGVVVSASLSKAFKSSSSIILLCIALTTGLG
jgi:hypothetical protein